MANEAAGLPVTFGAPVPDVFADEAVMFDMVNGTLRVTFGVVAPVEPAVPTTMGMAVIGRLILPVPSAQRLCLGLYDYLKNQGLDPMALLSQGDETAQ